MIIISCVIATFQLAIITLCTYIYQRDPTTEFVRPAEKFCRSLVDYRQRQPFFFGERYDFGTKIGISEIDSN